MKDVLSYLATKTSPRSLPSRLVAVVVWGLAEGDTEIYGLLRGCFTPSALPIPLPRKKSLEAAKTSPQKRLIPERSWDSFGFDIGAALMRSTSMLPRPYNILIEKTVKTVFASFFFASDGY